MTKKRTVPEVRFKGFEGEWEEKKLLDTVEKITDFRGRTPKKLGLEWSKDGYLALSALNVKNGYIDTTVDAHYGNQDLYEVWMKGSDLHEGQVLFTTEAPMGNVAQVPDDKKYILSQRVIAFNVDSQIIAENFLAVILRVPEVHTRLCSLASGGTAKGVSQRSLADVKFLIPEYPKEQTRIGELFRNLDARITLEQRKHEKLKNIKKAMLEKMFPKPGATVPEVRFKGFEGEWEGELLEKVAYFSKGHGYSKSDLIISGTPIILYGRLYTNYETVIEYLDTYTTDKLESVYSTGIEVIVPASGESAEDIARASAVKITGAILGGDLNIVRPTKEIDSVFLALSISNGEQQKKLSKRAQGKSVVHLRNSDLKEINLPYPNKTEQTRIGDFFRNLDSLISLQQRKCEKLQNIKKAMLDKMFV